MSPYGKLLADPFLGKKSYREAVEEAKITSQAEVLARLLNGENLFISGPAGSGKTFIINRFIELLSYEFENRVNVAITASTGIAAQLLGGQTIHSWSGIGLNTKPFKGPVGREYSKAADIIACDVLIIDEISMLPAYFFSRLDKLMKHHRKSKEPFGGVQLVVMGDFMQLPPIPQRPKEPGEEPADSRFCARTDAWKEAKLRTCYLDVIRRSKDTKLQEILEAISNQGNDPIEDRQNIARAKRDLESRIKPDEEKNSSKKYVSLYTLNRDVDKYNEEQLALNPNPATSYSLRKSGDSRYWETIVKSNGLKEQFVAKEGATVMLTANLSPSLANGSIGEVIELHTEYIRVRFNSGTTAAIGYRDSVHRDKVQVGSREKKGKKIPIYEEKEVARISFIPLKLAYAISVHKAQGQTMDGVKADLSKIFTDGLGYVALSRVRNLDDLILVQKPNSRAFKVSKESIELSRKTKRAARRNRQKMLKNMAIYERYLSGNEKKLTGIFDQEGAEVDEFADLGSQNLAPTDLQLDGFGAGLELLPEDFVSYEQLLANPWLRSSLWEPRIEATAKRVGSDSPSFMEMSF